MKKLLLSLTIVLFAAGVSRAQQVNDPNAELRNVKGFTSIKISNAFDVYLTQSNDDAVAVSASEDRFRDKIKTEVNNGVLTISYEERSWNSEKKKLKAYISFKNLKKLVVSGACDVFILGSVSQDQLTVDLSGASDLKTSKEGKGQLDIKQMDIQLSGASDMTVSGNVAQLKIDASGASDFKGFDLATDYCDATASGASSVKITVNKELTAHASGASDVHYKGDGMIKEIKTSGASNISKRS
jgi:hypothetical protein